MMKDSRGVEVRMLRRVHWFDPRAVSWTLCGKYIDAHNEERYKAAWADKLKDVTCRECLRRIV